MFNVTIIKTGRREEDGTSELSKVTLEYFKKTLILNVLSQYICPHYRECPQENNLQRGVSGSSYIFSRCQMRHLQPAVHLELGDDLSTATDIG